MTYLPKSQVRNAGTYRIHTQLWRTPIIEHGDIMYEVVPRGIFKTLKRLLLHMGMIGAVIIAYQIPKSSMNTQDSE